MSMKLSRPALDPGIVTCDGPAMLGFYADVLGFERLDNIVFPGLGTVHKFSCGHSQLKLLVLEKRVTHRNPGGGFSSATGFRYMSASVTNLDEVVAACRSASLKVVVDITELRPGVRAAMVEDPDGNPIELMQFAQGKRLA